MVLGESEPINYFCRVKYNKRDNEERNFYNELNSFARGCGGEGYVGRTYDGFFIFQGDEINLANFLRQMRNRRDSIEEVCFALVSFSEFLNIANLKDESK